MSRKGRLAVVAGALALMVVAAACSSNKNNGTNAGGSGAAFTGVPLTGAGSTFAAPIYTQWAKDFTSVESNAKINYQAIGSGGGVDAFTKRTVDFGASDAPLQDSQTSSLPGAAVEIPTVLGGVALAYNPTGIAPGVKLDGQTIADIFLRKITTWDDAAIKALNPGVQLPSTPISVVHRSDDSGTTFVFTNWLSSESPDWKKQVGANTTVQWPAGEAGKDGSDGVAAFLTQTQGSIGYISYDYAVANNLGVAAVKAADGTFVAPSVDSISAAGSSLSFPISGSTSILNSTAAGAYPLATTTYILIYTDQTNMDKGQTLFDFVYWGLTKGQGEVSQLNYAPLPADIAQKALDQLKQVTSGGSPLTPSSSVT